MKKMEYGYFEKRKVFNKWLLTFNFGQGCHLPVLQLKKIIMKQYKNKNNGT